MNNKIIILLLLLNSSPVLSETYYLSADIWASPRSALSVSQMPAINSAVLKWQKSTDSTLEILYPGGENGELWASELKDWLISLGIPEQSTRLNSGSAFADKIQISIQKNE